MISDISATGARLQMRYAPPEGVRGVLSWGGIDCGCEVVWSAKNSFGVAFSENVSVPDSLVKQAATPNSRVPNVSALPLAGPPPWSVDRRSVRRRSIERPVEVRQAEQWIKVVLKGISHQGFEVGWFPRCKDSAPISLRGAGLPVLHGRVVATDRLRVCCKLREQLHDAVLNHISAQLGLEG